MPWSPNSMRSHHRRIAKTGQALRRPAVPNEHFERALAQGAFQPSRSDIEHAAISIVARSLTAERSSQGGFHHGEARCCAKRISASLPSSDRNASTGDRKPFAQVTSMVIAISWMSAPARVSRSVPRGSRRRMRPLAFSTPLLPTGFGIAGIPCGREHAEQQVDEHVQAPAPHMMLGLGCAPGLYLR